MQTITTKYTGPNNTKGARTLAKSWIKNKASQWNYGESVEANHMQAAKALIFAINCDRVKAGHGDYQWEIIAVGALPCGSGNAYVIDLQKVEA